MDYLVNTPDEAKAVADLVEHEAYIKALEL
jgi:hypothetical protein